MTLTESSALSPEQLRVAVAERLGWTHHSVSKDDPFLCEKCGMLYSRSIWKAWEIPYLWCKKDGKENPPNYPSDLNACAEFEKTLATDDQIEQYLEALTDVCGGDTPTGTASFTAYFATAPQRCRAFLAVGETRNE